MEFIDCVKRRQWVGVMRVKRMWMLLAGLLLAVGTLGCRREAVIAEIEVLGGGESCIEYDEESPGRPIVGVNFEFSPLVTDDSLEILQGLNSLKRLNLNDTRNLTDAGLVHLDGLTNLQTLGLASKQITDVGLKHVAGLTNIQWLHLTDTQVADAGLEHLKGLTKLRHLHLFRTQVTGGAGLALWGLWIHLFDPRDPHWPGMR